MAGGTPGYGPSITVQLPPADSAEPLSCSQCFGSGFIYSRSGSNIIEHRLNTNPDPDPYLGVWWPKIKNIYTWNLFVLIRTLGLHAYRTSKLQEKPSALQKENIQHSKTWNFLPFSIFVVHFAPPGFWSGSTDLLEAGSNPDLDPKHCLRPSWAVTRTSSLISGSFF